MQVMGKNRDLVSYILDVYRVFQVNLKIIYSSFSEQSVLNTGIFVFPCVIFKTKDQIT